MSALDLGWLLNAGVMRLLAGGLAMTFALTALSAVLAFVLGTALALARMSRLRAVRWPAALYIDVIRSLPLLLIIFTVYFASKPLLDLNLDPFPAAVIALSGFTAAVVAEIMRAGILSVDRGVIQAAEAQGFAPPQVFLLIRFPIALRRMVPALLSQLIALIKSTSLVVVIGVHEFFERAILITTSPPYRPLPVYVLVAVVYFAINYALSLLSRRLEDATTGGVRAT
ncbi:MAG: amino acid ABC transporter permease [Alphaproteobacteria bacterium]|nr:amino acid ABC transporter permease [Alphaproteobacteria bacterium]